MADESTAASPLCFHLYRRLPIKRRKKAAGFATLRGKLEAEGMDMEMARLRERDPAVDAMTEVVKVDWLSRVGPWNALVRRVN